MDVRIHANAENIATIICPQCQKSKTVDVSRFADSNKTIRIKSSCLCGHRWTSVLEKRKKYRKTVSLSGTYDHIVNGKLKDRGGMKVVDLSSGGVKMQLNVERNLAVGDHLNIEFHLDDANQTLMKKSVTVRNVSGVLVGANFSTSDPYDPALGFYLMVDNRRGEDRRQIPDRRDDGSDDFDGPENRTNGERRNGEDRRGVDLDLK